MNTRISLIIASLTFTSCSIIGPDEVAVKRRLGVLQEKVYGPGPVTFNPFLTTIIRTPVSTINLPINLGLPSREGLTVQSEISILYRIKKEKLKTVIQEVGLDFENVLILPVFRSAAADICARFDAKDMHSAKRSEIEKQIKNRMLETIASKGFEIEEVLMKSISLPPGLAKAIEEKLNAEQDALRLEFVKERERKDAERRVIQAKGEGESQIIAAEAQKRKIEIEAQGRANALRIEAEGQQKANELLNSNLSQTILKLKSIEAFAELAKSNNSKVIITDGKTPFLSLPEGK